MPPDINKTPPTEKSVDDNISEDSRKSKTQSPRRASSDSLLEDCNNTNVDHDNEIGSSTDNVDCEKENTDPGSFIDKEIDASVTGITSMDTSLRGDDVVTQANEVQIDVQSITASENRDEVALDSATERTEVAIKEEEYQTMTEGSGLLTDDFENPATQTKYNENLSTQLNNESDELVDLPQQTHRTSDISMKTEHGSDVTDSRFKDESSPLTNTENENETTEEEEDIGEFKEDVNDKTEPESFTSSTKYTDDAVETVIASSTTITAGVLDGDEPSVKDDTDGDRKEDDIVDYTPSASSGDRISFLEKVSDRAYQQMMSSRMRV